MTATDDDFEAQLARGNRRRRVVLGAFAAAVLGGVSWLGLTLYHRVHPPPRPVVALTGPERAQLAEQIRASRVALLAANRPWRAQVAAVAPLEVPTDAPRCTRLDFYRERLDLHPQNWGGWELGRRPFVELGEALSITHHGSWSITRVPYPIAILPPDAPLPEHSAELRFRLEELEREEAALDRPGYAAFGRRLEDVTHTELYATEIMLRVVGSMAPRAASGRHVTTFEPGVLVAEGWMYNHREDRVVCAGVVRVENSAFVDLRSTGLNEDLIINLIREAPGDLAALR
jgi:hypothetical protein